MTLSAGQIEANPKEAAHYIEQLLTENANLTKQLSDVAKALAWQHPYQASLAERAASLIARCDALKVERDAAVAAERDRCAAIVSAARFDEVDRDFRAIGHMIEGGLTVEQIKG